MQYTDDGSQDSDTFSLGHSVWSQSWIMTLKPETIFNLYLHVAQEDSYCTTHIYRAVNKMIYLSGEWLRLDIITCLCNYTGHGLTSGQVFNNFCISLRAICSFTLTY